MLNDKEESIAFNSKEFIKLYQSTLGKIDILSSLLERVLDESLKTNAIAKFLIIYHNRSYGILNRF